MNPARFRRGLAVVAIVATVLLVLVFALTSRKPARTSVERDQLANAVEAEPAGPRGDLFQSLRRTTADDRATETSAWPSILHAIERLKTIDGAAVDEETGQLLLAGESTDAPGPITLDDITVALRAAFLEREEVGMTIDEDPNDKEGPRMFVKFFGGTKDTHFGQVMFECDRLMKSLGLGEDNLTKQPLSARFPGFATHAALVRRYEPDDTHPSWSRFWINIATGRNDAETILGVSASGHTIWIDRYRVFVDTEQMLDAGKGKRLVSSGGRQSESSRRFADLLNNHYDQLAEEYPAFGQLRELAKLVVIAEWIHETRQPIDSELLYLRSDRRVRTPEDTPTLRTKLSWDAGVITMFGGVSLAPKNTYVSTPHANDLGAAVADQRQALQAGRPIGWQRRNEAPRQVVAIGHPPIRAPGRPLRIVPSGRSGATSAFRAQAGKSVSDTLGGYNVPIVADPTSGRELLNWPVLRTTHDVRRTETRKFSSSSGGPVHEVDVPASLQLTSPLGDINIRFEHEPKFDPERGEGYFESTWTPKVTYFPKSGTLRDADGRTFHVDDAGLVDRIEDPSGLRLRIDHVEYRDGTLSHADLETKGPRGPPLRILEAGGMPSPSSSAADRPLGQPTVRMTIHNLRSGRAISVLDADGTYFVSVPVR